MNITFIIGNGFDISQGLKTRYQDFYQYYLKNTSEDDIIRCAIEKDKKNDYINWSDLEFALGEFTETLKEDQIDVFVKSKVILDKLLKQYLVSEEKKFVVDKTDKKLYNALKKIRTTNYENETKTIESVYKENLNYQYIYRAIVFNYTNAFEKVWDVLKGESVGTHKYVNSLYQEKVGDLLYIHGTLHNREMIVGLNDESQIKNLKLRNNINLKRVLIKPLLNDNIGQNKNQKAKDIINNSMLICLFGVSIGATDKIWWDYIGKWLLGSRNRLLIIYNYDLNYQPEHIYEIIEHKDIIKSKFLDLTTLNQQEKEKIISQIIVCDNENVFQEEK